MSRNDKSVSVIDPDGNHPSLPMIEGDGIALALVWPGIGARSRSMHRISLRPSARTIPLAHPMEAVYYVMSGTAEVLDPETGTTQFAEPGSMIFVEPSTTYVISADGEAVELVGGPCPPDPELYRKIDQAGPSR